MTDVIAGSDSRARCAWAGSTQDYLDYHDQEWGVEVRGDDALFERMSLEAFQSGLSWLTILRKRPAFRSAFAGFVIADVAEYGAVEVERLIADTTIVRNGAKIEAVIGNARVAAGMPEGLSDLLWSFAPAQSRRPETLADIPSSTSESTAMARELKRRGFRFVGPTTSYALMQATGMVDDHVSACWRAH